VISSCYPPLFNGQRGQCRSPQERGVGFVAFAHTSIVSAQDAVSSPKPSAEELAKLKQNPLSGLREIIFQAEVSPNVPGSGETFGSYSIQPVWPFSLSKDWKVNQKDHNLCAAAIVEQPRKKSSPGSTTSRSKGD
jgi:hypothetical protein